MMIGYVYKLTMNASPAFYIGSTQNTQARFTAHKSELRRGVHGSHMFQEAWSSSGSTELFMEILFVGSMENAQAFELDLLQTNSGSPELKNTSVQSLRGVDMDRIKNPEELRAKRSVNVSGENNPMFGKSHSAEARDKMSKALTGKPAPWAAGPKSEEVKRKISETKLLNPPSGDKNPFYGKKHSEETIEKLRQWNLDRSKADAEAGRSHVQAARIVIDGIEYPSQSAAARALGVSPALITHRLKNPDKYPNYQSIKPASN